MDKTGSAPDEGASLQREIQRRLATAGSTAGKIAATVKGSTVLLTGDIIDAGLRKFVVDDLLDIPAVDRVVDATSVGYASTSPKIHLKPGASLSSAFKDLFDPNATWK